MNFDLSSFLGALFATYTGIIITAALFYFLPSLIAFTRHHHNTTAIVFTNLLLGWTFLGWVAAFVWALTNPAPPQANPIIAKSDPPIPPTLAIPSKRAATNSENRQVPTIRSAMPGHESADSDPSKSGRVACPECAEMIMPAAKKCRFCATELPPGWHST